MDAERGEHDEDAGDADEQDPVDTVGGPEPDDVDEGGEGHVDDQPGPFRHGRELGVQVDGLQEPGDHRQEKRVEQEGPPGEESDAGVEFLADLPIGAVDGTAVHIAI
ncbi:hypothetical protein [Streptomyces sp. NPDC101237]|uniref:hypothetical protein n=1 Tax=Streptomyces sp. NPDC101237 TaxID=3366139 RepID=UPI003825A67C